MMKAVKLTIGSLLLGAMLAVAGTAQPINFAADAQEFIQKEKDKEKPVERDKKDERRDERRDNDKKDDKGKKKPD